MPPPFADAFDYPAGTLTGMGLWEENPDNTSPWEITGPGSIHGPALTGASNLAPVAANPWLPWQLAVTMTLPAPSNSGEIDVFFADEATRSSMVMAGLGINALSDPPTFNLTNGVDASADVNYTPGVPFELVVTWDGTTLTYTIDGVAPFESGLYPTPRPGPSVLLLNYSGALATLAVNAVSLANT